LKKLENKSVNTPVGFATSVEERQSNFQTRKAIPNDNRGSQLLTLLYATR